jgi:ankyrin repeat protein
MSSLGEVYGRPPRKRLDAISPVKLVELLLARGAQVDTTLKSPTLTRNHTPGEPALGEGTTPLMRAAKHGDAAVVKVLLAHNASPRLLQKNKTTALMMASGVGRGLGVFSKDIGSEADLCEAARLLIESGADVNAVNDAGLTAVHYAAQAGLDSVVSLLAKHGARLDVKDKQGRTPVDVALGVGGRGRAGGPAPVYEHTAALLRRLKDSQ